MMSCEVLWILDLIASRGVISYCQIHVSVMPREAFRRSILTYLPSIWGSCCHRLLRREVVRFLGYYSHR